MISHCIAPYILLYNTEMFLSKLHALSLTAEAVSFNYAGFQLPGLRFTRRQIVQPAKGASGRYGNSYAHATMLQNHVGCLIGSTYYAHPCKMDIPVLRCA